MEWEEKLLRQNMWEIYKLLKDHPTNKEKLSCGEDGYDHWARYAYLVAKDTLIQLHENIE